MSNDYLQNFDVFGLADRAKTAISLGESHYREFKSALHGPEGQKTRRPSKEVADDIASTLVAFANADGGELLVGVEDTGQISGLSTFKGPDIAQLLAAPVQRVHKDTPLQSYRAVPLDIDSQTILYFSILKSTEFVHLTSDGRCLVRKDSTSVPLPAEHVQFSRQEAVSREYDRAFVDGATTDALNLTLVSSVANMLSPGMTTERCLQYLDLAEFTNQGLKLRRAALLLFAKEPLRWHPRLQVRILKVTGTEILTGDKYNVVTDDVVAGNILEILHEGWERLRPHLVQTRLSEAARFTNTAIYPEHACREALINAVAHRDYAQEGRGIEITVFTDRLEFRSPGALLATISIDDLYRLEGVHQSRNTFVARVLRELGYMLELGEGVRRIFQLMKTNELAPPDLENKPDSFAITLHYKTIYSRDEQLFLDQFSAFSLTREQKAIIVLGKGGRLVAPQEIWDALGIVDTEHYRQIVSSLQSLGLLHSDVTKNRASLLGLRKHIPRKQIPRFKIVLPQDVRPTKTAREVTVLTDKSLDAPTRGAQLFVANISPGLAPRAAMTRLEELFEPFGSIGRIRVPRGFNRGNRGYAFLDFIDVASATLAKAATLSLDGRPLVVRDLEPQAPSE